MDTPNYKSERRQFLQTAGAIAAAPLVLGSSVFGTPRVERVGVGLIGYGIRSRNLLSQYLNADELTLVGVAEVVKVRRDEALQRINTHYGETTATAHDDFRELIARDDVDAVIVMTPDHWHAIPAIEACRAGKAVYCEKPLSLTIAEGRSIANAARDSGVPFQTGSQQRTEYGGRFVRAAQAVRNGRIGKVTRVEVGVGDPPVPCDLAHEDTPEGTDWTMWNGPSPARGFSSTLCPLGMHSHYPQWRNYREYANGGLADMGAHHFDIVQWALDMDTSGPREILPPEGDAIRGLRFLYDNGVEVTHGGNNDCRFEGTDGWIEVGRGYLRASDDAILEVPLAAGELELPRSPSHIRNWIDGIVKGTPTVADAETGHRTATVCQLAVIGYQVRKRLTWDPVSERFRGDNATAANALLARKSNAAWQTQY